MCRPDRFHAHRGRGVGSEAPGRSSRSPAGLRELSTRRGPSTRRKAAHDASSAAADSHQSHSALLQHQDAGQGAHAQTLPGNAGGQGLIGPVMSSRRQRMRCDRDALTEEDRPIL